ncbi:hypothetical protein HBH70_051880 [Parastagonospora nodorum]|nr:hypothetical protein HBI10_055740 [Parastagonospora nodorum]KAH4029254.1 hypothetical protein HBI13_046590 [Parastagonospora nodorum]KAH5074769.1 hypothetical protein HBH95_139150 [Parastagonospora nodorum]KAH5144595.1 hypothetical protein HBH70_051880 [Parastagonospora nodorum]KAH5313849.1 hypothetical protein HBI11_075930 [Parastagonospora nodorum]
MSTLSNYCFWKFFYEVSILLEGRPGPVRRRAVSVQGPCFTALSIASVQCRVICPWPRPMSPQTWMIRSECEPIP